MQFRTAFASVRYLETSLAADYLPLTPCRRAAVLLVLVLLLLVLHGYPGRLRIGRRRSQRQFVPGRGAFGTCRHVLAVIDHASRAALALEALADKRRRTILSTS